MANFDMSDYVDVAERIREFREKYPEGTLQAEIIPLPDSITGFIAVKAYAYRAPDDPRPGVGLAYEPVPGKTPYTKDSELQNAETSAWGRAIIAVGVADTKRGVASANEVRNRRADQDAPSQPPQPAEPAEHPATESALIGILERLRPLMATNGNDYPDAWRDARAEDGKPGTYQLASLEEMVTGARLKCSAASAAKMAEVLDGIEAAQFAAQPCSLCGSTRSERVSVGGTVRCAKAGPCEKRAAEKEAEEAPF